MSKYQRLIKLDDTFSSNEAVEVGLSSYHLRRLEEKGTIEKISRGVYRKIDAGDQESEVSYAIASKKIVQKNAICLLSALEYHHLTEAMPREVWLLVNDTTKTIKPGITLFRRRNPQWNIGIDVNGAFLVTNLERSVVESLCFKQKVGPNEAYYALENVLKSKRSSISKIVAMAKALGCYERIKDHLEPFIYG